jgi:hypothetical protein
MDGVEPTVEKMEKAELEYRAKDLLAHFVQKDEFSSSTLSRSPLRIVDHYRIYVYANVWDEAGRTDELVLWKLMERLKQYVSRNKAEEEFIETCFQSISTETPTLTRVIGHALPPLLWVVFDRYPQMLIWQRTKEGATPETVELHKKWNKLVLLMLERHVQKGEEIPRKDLIARRINDESMREAVDVLVAGYMRYMVSLRRDFEANFRKYRDDQQSQSDRDTAYAECGRLKKEIDSFPPLPIE